MPAALTFRTAVELGGQTATGLCIPDEVVAGLGRGKRPPVCVTIGEHTYRSTVASMGGRFMVPLSAENRARAGVAAGDEIEVRVQLDTGSRSVEVPADLAAALAEDEGAKKAETRQRRVDKAVAMRRAGRAQG